MDTIASMRAFVAVAKTGSFSAAAQKLDLVPSVITKRVTQLERIVGTTLFHRSTRKVVLSADGEHHLERIIAAIAAHDQALSELRKGVRRLTGPIRIKVPTTLGFGTHRPVEDAAGQCTAALHPQQRRRLRLPGRAIRPADCKISKKVNSGGRPTYRVTPAQFR